MISRIISRHTIRSIQTISDSCFDWVQFIDSNHGGGLFSFRDELLLHRKGVEAADDLITDSLIGLVNEEYDYADNLDRATTDYFGNLRNLAVCVLFNEEEYEVTYEESNLEIFPFSDLIDLVVEEYDDTRGIIVGKANKEKGEGVVEFFEMGYAEVLHLYHKKNQFTVNDTFQYNMARPMQGDDIWCLNVLEDQKYSLAEDLHSSNPCESLFPNNLRNELREVLSAKGYDQTKVFSLNFEKEGGSGREGKWDEVMCFMPEKRDDDDDGILLSYEEILYDTLGDENFLKVMFWGFPRWMKWVIVDKFFPSEGYEIRTLL